MNRNIVSIAIVALLAACGGSGSGGNGDATGSISVAMTDAAVDNVAEVWVEFSSITLKPASGDEIHVDFDPVRTINLLELQDGKTAALLPDTRVPVGQYNWMRLGVNAEFDGVMDSYVYTNMGENIELRIPSGSQTGLKLVSGFTVTQNQSTNLVVDWDLRKALSDPKGQPGMHLRPALRVTDMAEYGTLTGAVDAELTMADNCGDDAAVGNAVYVYQDVVEEPADIQGMETDPLVTATVGDDLSYTISFLSTGEYTVAFTCQAELDDSEAEDDIEFAPIVTGVSISNGETTTLDLAASAP